MLNINEHTLEHYRQGTRVELIHMNDTYNTKLVYGCKGTVCGVDDVGTIHVNRDCGSLLCIALGVDHCRKIE